MLVTLTYSVTLGGCFALPVKFEKLSETQRVQVSTEAFLISCAPRTAEDSISFYQAFAFRRATQYINFINNYAKEGELHRFIKVETLTPCLHTDLEGEFFRDVRHVVYRKGSDAEVVAAFAYEFNQISYPVSCQSASSEYPLDIAERINKLVCTAR
jgi:hypothetical protein